MKKKNLSLKLAALLLACGGFGAVFNFANPALVYAMEGNNGQSNVQNQNNEKNDYYTRAEVRELVRTDEDFKKNRNWMLHTCPFEIEKYGYGKYKMVKMLYGFDPPDGDVLERGFNCCGFGRFGYFSTKIYPFVKMIGIDCNFTKVVENIYNLLEKFSEYFKDIDAIDKVCGTTKGVAQKFEKLESEKPVKFCFLEDLDLKLNNKVQSEKAQKRRLVNDKHRNVLKEAINLVLSSINQYYKDVQKKYDEFLANYLDKDYDFVMKHGIEAFEEVAWRSADKISDLMTFYTRPSLYDLFTNSEELAQVAPERKGLLEELFGEQFADFCEEEMDRICNTAARETKFLKEHVREEHGGGIFGVGEKLEKLEEVSGEISDSEDSEDSEDPEELELLNKKKVMFMPEKHEKLVDNAHLEEKNKTGAQPNPVLAALVNVINNSVDVESSANLLPANINDASLEQLQRFRLFLANEYKFNFICDPNNINSLKEAVQPYYDEYASKYNEYLLKNKTGAQPNPVLAAPINVVNNDVGVESSAENVAGNLDNGNNTDNKPKKEIEFITKKRKKTDN